MSNQQQVEGGSNEERSYRVIDSAVDEMIKRHIESVFMVKSQSELSEAETKSKGAIVVDRVMNELRTDPANYKYIVSCTVMPKNGAGLHAAASCYWDNRQDGGTAVRWENRYLTCIVHVFVLGN